MTLEELKYSGNIFMDHFYDDFVSFLKLDP